MERAAEREKALFTFEWHYAIRLDRCLLYLKPDDLPIRRVWNKKYPMKLCLPTMRRRDGFRKRRINSTFEELTVEMNAIVEHSTGDAGEIFFDSDSDSEAENVNSSTSTVEESDEDFYLFSNTGREKEDLFYRIQLCIKPLKHQVQIYI